MSILQRIMELQTKGELTESEATELDRLSTDWSNRWCQDSPTKR